MLQTCILVGFFMHPGSFWASFPCKFNFCAEEEGENSRHHQHQEPKTTFSVQTAPSAERELTPGGEERRGDKSPLSDFAPVARRIFCQQQR